MTTSTWSILDDVAFAHVERSEIVPPSRLWITWVWLGGNDLAFAARDLVEHGDNRTRPEASDHDQTGGEQQQMAETPRAFALGLRRGRSRDLDWSAT